jgi:sugar lactone lactonase YvrE
MVSTLAGRATDLAASADGVGAAARFKSPSGIAADRAGTLYVADTTANTVRKITAAGQVTTLAGKTGVRGHIDGLGVAALFDGPSGIAVDSSGTRDGLVSTLAGTAGVRGSVDGMGTAAQFSTPTGIAIDGDGNLFVTDEWANNIRKVTPAGEVTTVANKTGQHGSIDGPAEQPRFVVPTGIAIDHAGNLYVCDYGNRTIRKITPGGVVTTVAGVAEQSGIKVGKLPGRLENTSGLAFIDSNTLVATERFSVLKILLNDR